MSGPPAPLQLAVFNRLEPTAAAQVVRPCFAVERWWSTVVDVRPYPDLTSLLLVARRAADPLTRRELDVAVADHLGGRRDHWLPVADVSRSGAEASVAALRDRIDDDSAAYLARFGRPFVVRTAGRSIAEVAAHLVRRLDHDAVSEDQVVAAALRQIALLALVRRIGG